MKVLGYGARNGLSGIAPDQAMRDRRDREVHDLIEVIRDSDESGFRKAQSDALRALLPFFDRWSYLICRNNGDFNYEHREDIVSIAAETATKMLTPEHMEGKAPSNWMPYLRRMMQNRSSTYFVSGDVNFVSGTTMLRRRRALIARYTEELRSLSGSEPTVDEVIEYANDILRNSRSNPERQSILLSEEDFEDAPSQVSYDSLSNVIGDESDQSLIHRVEGEAIVRAIVSAAGEITADHAVIADAWVGDLYGDDPTIRSGTEIASSTGMPLGIVESMLEDVREVAQNVSRQKFGIEFAAV